MGSILKLWNWIERGGGGGGGGGSLPIMIWWCMKNMYMHAYMQKHPQKKAKAWLEFMTPLFLSLKMQHPQSKAEAC